MSKSISGMMGGGGKKKKVEQRHQQQQQQTDRMTEQARQLNARNNELAGEARTARNARRGRRLLAYKGQETGLRDKLAA